ncbi:MAG: apolipoprotein N-acyltransferase [Acidimicrobiales bacterium]|nr:MAG: apolipoprotein N-acyltransferase [Acidimicrobiales bacterium]
MIRPRLTAVAAGLLIAAGLPPWGWWPLTLVGLALWFRLLEDVSRRRRVRRSLVVGLLWFTPGTLWMFDLTAAGWPVAVIVFSLLAGLAGALTPATGAGRPAAFAGAVVVMELIRWHVPFGGVPIATIAMATVGTPWAISAQFLGSLFLVALTILIAVAGLRATRDPRALGIVAALVVGGMLLGHLGGISVSVVDELGVAVVQGGGPQNTRADVCENRQVFERHVAATETIAADADVDLILWPEDVVHPSTTTALTPSRCAEDLLRHDEAVGELQRLASEYDATIISGWFERSADGTANENYSIIIEPDGTIGDRYDKVRLVPFGEFVPLRSFIENFSDEVPGRDVRSGTEPAVLESRFGPLGVSISWEVFFDYRARDAMNHGGLALLNPTNGSSYWLTIVQTQQVASSRLRAIETDRWVLQAAPTGFSAVVAPDGDVLQRTAVSEQAVLFDTIELREGRTLATVVGPWPMLLLALAALGRARIRLRSRA